MHSDLQNKPIALRLYRGATRAISPFASRILAGRLRKGKEDALRLDERKGIASIARPDGKLVWFHAASVGEALSALPLKDAIKQAYPQVQFLMTTGTVTSAALIATRAPDMIHQYVPLDGVGAVRRFLGHWRPDLAIWMESELWPNLITETAAQEIPLVLANARVSDKSAKGWAKAPGMGAALLNRFSLRLVQTQDVHERLIGMGAKAEGMHVTGDMKAARAPLALDPQKLSRLTASVAGVPLWLAASTHPKDEACILSAHETLAGRIPELLTIIAPRHTERGEPLQTAAEAKGLPVLRRSQGAKPGAGQLYIADTMGEMDYWYSLAPLAVIGGGWHGEGGHNPMEAAQRGAAVLSGASVANFEGGYAPLIRAGAARFVAPDDLAGMVAPLLGADGSGSAALEAMRAAAQAHGQPDMRPLECSMDALRPVLERVLS